MAELSENSKEYVKGLKQNAPVTPQDIFKVLQDLKEKLNARRIASKASRKPSESRK